MTDLTPAALATAPPGRGVVLRGRVWTGGGADPFDGTVSLDGAGRIVRIDRSDRPDREHDDDLQAGRSADDLVIGSPDCWVGPGIVDSHVHQAFAEDPFLLGPGLVAARDLGAPLADALAWRDGAQGLGIAGPVLTATDGYPARSWGADGFARFVDSPDAARRAVGQLARAPVDVVKLALEPGPGWPTPDPDTARAVVDAAHAHGLAVVAHAVRRDMLHRALDAGVDELAHTPGDRLAAEDVERISAAGVCVVSTLQTFFADGDGRTVALNAADLVSAGVTMRYGTDLGNAGTRSGVDPRELDRLADAGLGRRGALLAATRDSARAPGVGNRTGLLEVGRPANLVVLSGDPEAEPAVWRSPVATVVDGRFAAHLTN